MDKIYMKEEELKKEVKELLNNLKSGNLNIVPSQENIEMINSINSIVLDSEEDVIVSSIDDNIINLIKHFKLINNFQTHQEKESEFSLLEIQNSYFEIIEKFFGFYYNKMLEYNTTPESFARYLSSDPMTVYNISNHYHDFYNIIEYFWNDFSEDAYIELKKEKGSNKAIFGGETFPQSNIASKYGVYTDTIILHDPFLRLRALLNQSTPEKRVYYMIKHGLSMLQYKSLACAELKTPIVIVIPDKKIYREQSFLFGENDAVSHLNSLFNTDLETYNEAEDFCSKITTFEKAEQLIKNPERILFSSTASISLNEKFKQAYNLETKKMFKTNNPGKLLLRESITRMAQANESLLKSRDLDSFPIIEAPVSWQYLNWKMDYDSTKINDPVNYHISHAIDNLDHKNYWLGNMSNEDLILIRKNESLFEIREMLNHNIEELININPANFDGTQEQLLKNIDQAFELHYKKIEKLKNKRNKFLSKDISSCLIEGTLQVTAILTGNAFLGITTYALGKTIDTMSWKDIPKEIKTLYKENETLKKSPVALMLKNKDHKK